MSHYVNPVSIVTINITSLVDAVHREIGHHKHAPLRCRFGWHDAADFWVAINYYDPSIPVEVRRCYLCGCAVEARAAGREHKT